MNNIVTSKKEILRHSRDLILEQGWDALSVRSVATACGVSVGSIYNYFESKSELASATIESVWCDIFHDSENTNAFKDTQTCVSWMFERIEYGCKKYPGFFAFHSLVFIQNEDPSRKQLMYKTWEHILNGLCVVLKKDSNIRSDAFNEQFTAEKFANTIFSLILSAIFCENYDASIVLEIVRRTLY